jgi:hypothetical protein
MRKTNALLLLGLVLLVAGVALLIYGITAYNEARASLGNALGKLFTGRSKEETRAVIEMIGGGAAAVVGLALLLTRGRGARRGRR